MHSTQWPQEALGESELFLALQEQISRVAPIERPVLLIGERGTGKELAAMRLHYLSKRWQSPFVTLNCSALNPSLIESELFGHERGAFTGAIQRYTGRFEVSDNGTLFLDEISNIPLEVQEKILRVVEYGTFERVGSNKKISINVRIIGATNADLQQKAAQGYFKQDLLDRLSFEVLFLPPLRWRKEDIPLLANYFAARMAHEIGHEEIPLFSEQAIHSLEKYHWPGNIRELKNVVERAVYRTNSSYISDIQFDPFDSPLAPQQAEAERPDRRQKDFPELENLLDLPLEEATRELHIKLLRRALHQARFNQKQAASLLGLTYNQFRGLYRKYKQQLNTNTKGSILK